MSRFSSALRGFFKGKRLLVTIGVLLLSFFTVSAFAGGVDMTQIQANMKNTDSNIMDIVNAIAIVGGIVFIMASLFQFYRWKMNPQQISIAQGLSLLLIGTIMVALPWTFTTAHRALLGTTSHITKFGSSSLADLVAPSSSDGGAGDTI